jgi:predicted HicB family RNase H-like nuclease
MVSVLALTAVPNFRKPTAGVGFGKTKKRSDTMHSIEGVAVDERVQIVQKKAHELFQGQINWAIFFREILGTNGIVHKLYPDEKSLAVFEKTREYVRLQEMLSQLRDVNGQPPRPEEEGTRVITVRLPSCVHEALKKEARARETSMNQLCISKLLQRMDAEATASNNGNQEQVIRAEGS